MIKNPDKNAKGKYLTEKNARNNPTKRQTNKLQKTLRQITDKTKQGHNRYPQNKPTEQQTSDQSFQSPIKIKKPQKNYPIQQN